MSSAGKAPAEAAHFGSSLALHPEDCLADTAVLRFGDDTEASANAHASQESFDDLSIFVQSANVYDLESCCCQARSSEGQLEKFAQHWRKRSS